MLPDQLKVLARKASKYFPLAAVSMMEAYLDKSLQKDHAISADSVYSVFEDLLEDLKEKGPGAGLP